MKIYESKSQFGWENDNGIGEILIQKIMAGEKTATTAPKSILGELELKELYESVGKPSTVIDKHNNPRCNILMVEVFETNFGQPDLRLIEGEGHGTDAEAFKKAHQLAWRDLVESGKLKLNDNTVLVVELFQLIRDE